MTDLTRRQHQELHRDRQLLLDVADLIAAMAEAIAAAHRAAAHMTTSDSPGSRWPDGDGGRPVGSHSDPVGSAALSDERANDGLRHLRSTLGAFRDAGYAALNSAQRISGRLAADDRQRQVDLELDAENIGTGNCDACDRHCPGGADRLRTVRKADGHHPGLAMCNACRMAWQRADYGTEVYAWCDLRRRRVERSA